MTNPRPVAAPRLSRVTTARDGTPERIPWWAWTPVVLYVIQLGIVAQSCFWPAIDVENADHRYVVMRFNGMPDFIPGIGLVPQITGEPVRLILTDKRSGMTTVTQADLIGDVAHDYPAVAAASYLKRLFDR